MTTDISPQSVLEIIIENINNLNNQCSDAAVLLAITQEAQPKILLTSRSLTMRHHAGEVSLPGGCRESFDYSNVDIVLREVYEELGLKSEHISILGELPTQQSLSGLTVTPLVALIPPNLQLDPNPTEVSDIFYIPLNYFLTEDTKSYEAQYPSGLVEVSSIHFKEKIIWGLTAKIIISLFEEALNHKKDWVFYSESLA